MANIERVGVILMKHQQDMLIRDEIARVTEPVTNGSVTKEASEILFTYGKKSPREANTRKTREAHFHLQNKKQSLLKLVGRYTTQERADSGQETPDTIQCLEYQTDIIGETPTVLFQIKNNIPLWHGKEAPPSVEELQDMHIVLEAIKEKLQEDLARTTR